VREAVIASRTPLTGLYRRLILAALADPARQDADLPTIADQAERLYVGALDLIAVDGQKFEKLAGKSMSFWLRMDTRRAPKEVPVRIRYDRANGVKEYWPTRDERRLRLLAGKSCYCWTERPGQRSSWSDAECAALEWNGTPFKTMLPIRRSRRAVKTNKAGCTSAQELFYDERGWPEERVEVWRHELLLVGDKYALRVASYLPEPATRAPATGCRATTRTARAPSRGTADTSRRRSTPWAFRPARSCRRSG
jgi:hypothetical protein